MTSFHVDSQMHDGRRLWVMRQWDALTTFLEENRQNIFYLFVFYVITVALFVERFIRKFYLKLIFLSKKSNSLSLRYNYIFILLLLIFKLHHKSSIIIFHVPVKTR